MSHLAHTFNNLSKILICYNIRNRFTDVDERVLREANWAAITSLLRHIIRK